MDLLSADDRQRIVSALDLESAGTVLTDATASIRAELVEEIEPERLARIAEALPADEAADLIGELEVSETEKVLHHISTEDEEVLRHLLTYPEDTAGGLMNPEVLALRPEETVDDAIRYLRSAAEDTPIAAVYVVDEDRHLLGFVPPSADGDSSKRSETRRHHVERCHLVRIDTDQEEVADVVDKYDFMAIPVVDKHNHLMGVVTVDDILHVIEEEATEDIYKMAGSSIEEEESESILHVARYRLPWVVSVSRRDPALFDGPRLRFTGSPTLRTNVRLHGSNHGDGRQHLTTVLHHHGAAPRTRHPSSLAFFCATLCGKYWLPS